jgi:hypothetical protein
LNEVDVANVPRDFSEMMDFVWYYECMIKWAVCINASIFVFIEFIIVFINHILIYTVDGQ